MAADQLTKRFQVPFGGGSYELRIVMVVHSVAQSPLDTATLPGIAWFFRERWELRRECRVEVHVGTRVDVDLPSVGLREP